MLTYPSDSLPQIVCPMEEDAIPPNPFCSAPPHSESPPPHPSLSSVTPSFENNGKFRNRRSGRLQGFQDPTPKKQRLSRQNPPPTKGERESGMVQWSLSAKQSRGKTLHEQKVKQNKDALHFDGWSECTTKHDDQTNRRAKGNIFATENGDKQFAGATSQDLDTSQSQTTCIDMDECAELAVEQPVEKPSLTKGWVIGPLFQSFKSKMASFSEIVMSPVKLFKAHTPLSRDQTDDLNLSHALCSEHSESTTEIQEQQTNENSKGVTQDFNVSSFGSRHQELDDQVSSPSAQIRFADVRCEKHFVDTAARNSQILCDGDSSTHSLPSVKECAFTEKESNTIQSVPLKHSPFRHDSPEKNLNSSKSVVKTSGLFQSSNNSGASCPSKQKKSGKMEEKKGRIAAGLQPQDTSKALPSEKPLDNELFFHMHEMKTTVRDSGDTGKAQSLPSTVYYTTPDTPCLPGDDDNCSSKRGGCISVRKSQRNISKIGGVTDKIAKTTLDAQPADKQHGEWERIPNTVVNSDARVQKVKRRLKLSSEAGFAADLVKRKRLRANDCMEEGNDGDLLATTSKSSISQGLNSSESEVDPSNIIKDMENSLNPSETNTLVSKGLKRKGGPRKSFAKRNKVVLHMDTVNPSGAIIVSLLRQGNGVPQTGQEDGKGRKNTSSTTKSLKRITNLCLSKADGSVDNLDLETTMTTNLTKGAQGQQLPEVLVQPLNEMLGSSQPASEVQPKSVCRKRVVSQVCIIEPSQGPSKLTNVDKKSHKRKTRKENSALKQGSIVNPTSTVLFTSKLTSTDRNASQLAHIEENWKKEQKAPSRRPKRVHEGTFKPSVLDGTQMTERSADSCQKLVKEGHSQGEKNVSLQSLIVHCGMMTIEDEHKPHPSPCLFEEPILQLDEQKVKNDLSGPSNCIRERPTASLPGKIFLAEAASLAENKGTDNEEDKHKKVESCSHVVGVNASELKHSRRGVKNRPSRARIETRKCKVLLNRVHEPEENQEGEMSIVSGKKVDLASAESCVSKNESFSGHLWRSHSCPEIPSLLHVHYDTPVITLPHSLQRSRVQATHQQQPVPVLPVPHARRSARRARRHTVCSVEVEREIAPLCLRKEVYPSRRTAPYGNITQYASPSASLSPSTSLTALASCFLFSPLAFLSKKLETRGVAAGSSSTCNHISSPSSPSVFTSSASPVASPAAWQQFPGCDVSAATASSTCSVLSQIHLGCEIDARRQHKEEEEDGEDTSCSSQEFEDVVLTEEKALSDSEIKVVKMNEGRGKVSSIRIRKTLPKPQNNLTPMGLPKPIRLKKKEFSLEEIYTNKNFTKPPESRLETIFEMPLSRRNGSQSLFGQKRVKRLVEFPDVSVARKPKKPLVGAGKAGITSSFGRPRRGGFLNSKDEPSISVQELDSLLCAKLGQLDLWLTSDQKDC